MTPRCAREFMLNYIFVAVFVASASTTTALITQNVIWVDDQQKQRRVVELISNMQRPHDRLRRDQARRRAARGLPLPLVVPATSIHGDRSQREREHALLAFRRGQPAVLVATDVAARGLDVPECMHVINYELPRDINSYVHRIGRTGRMGRHGTAVSLFGWANRPVARELLQLLQEAEQVVPEWLTKFAAEAGVGGRGYGGGGRSRQFGGRDYRQNAQVRTYRHGQQGGMGGYGGSGLRRLPGRRRLRWAGRLRRSSYGGYQGGGGGSARRAGRLRRRARRRLRRLRRAGRLRRPAAAVRPAGLRSAGVRPADGRLGRRVRPAGVEGPAAPRRPAPAAAPAAAAAGGSTDPAQQKWLAQQQAAAYAQYYQHQQYGAGAQQAAYGQPQANPRYAAAARTRRWPGCRRRPADGRLGRPGRRLRLSTRPTASTRRRPTASSSSTRRRRSSSRRRRRRRLQQ